MQSKRHINLLYNTFSGKGKGMSVAAMVKKELKLLEIPCTEYKNEWPAVFNENDEIWLIGGDGTLNYFVNKYGVIDNSIALFAGGTGNDFHWHLYGQIKLTDEIKFVLKTSAKPIDIGKCNGKYFINMVGLGFDGAVLKGIDSVKWIGGHFAYLIAVIRNIFSYKEIPLTIKLNEKEIKESLLLCIISNAPRTGGGFMVSPNAQSNDGLLNWIMCKPMSVLERLRFLPKVEKGSHLTNAKVSEELVTTIEISSEIPIYYQLDGELLCNDQFHIEVVKNGLIFLY